MRIDMLMRSFPWILAVALLLQAAAALADAKDEARRALEAKGYAFTEEKFFYAIAARQAEMVELYLKAGMDAHAKDPDIRTGGCFPIHFAADIGDYEIVKVLIQYGADVNAKAPERRGFTTPLYQALSKGHREMASFLLDRV